MNERIKHVWVDDLAIIIFQYFINVLGIWICNRKPVSTFSQSCFSTAEAAIPSSGALISVGINCKTLPDESRCFDKIAIDFIGNRNPEILDQICQKGNYMPENGEVIVKHYHLQLSFQWDSLCHRITQPEAYLVGVSIVKKEYVAVC